jgi:radical SAM protein with 4Fe4S-binding SPASM domain
MVHKFRNLNMELSSACNFDCSYCPEHKMTRKKSLMDYDLAIDLLDQIKEMNLTKEINFYHMGESLLHKRAVDIFAYAKQNGFRVKLNTNGSRLTPEMRKSLLQLDIDNLSISYHSSYVKFNKFATFKTPISFEQWHEQILSTVEDRYKYDSKSEVVIILFKAAKALRKEQIEDVRLLETDEEVEEALGVWLELGKKLAQQYNLPYLYDRDTKPLAKKIIHSVFDRANKTFPVIPGFSVGLLKVHTWSNDVVCGTSEGKQKPIKKAYFGGCDALSDSMAIFADGRYSLCCADWDGKVVVGNAHTQPLKEFLDSEKATFIRESFKKGKLPMEYCKQCRGGCTTKSWAFNQVHSYVYYNSETYRKLRHLVNMD